MNKREKEKISQERPKETPEESADIIQEKSELLENFRPKDSNEPAFDAMETFAK